MTISYYDATCVLNIGVGKTSTHRLSDTIWVWYVCVQKNQMNSVFVALGP